MTNNLKITFDDNLVTGNKTIDAQHPQVRLIDGQDITEKIS